MHSRRLIVVAAVAVGLALGSGSAVAQGRSREAWLALRDAGFAVPPGETAAGLLIAMNGLLASPDPVLRDEVAYAAAERWILRDRAVGAEDLRRLQALWTANLDDGLGTAGDDRVFGRSFSALCLSLVAARDLATPFLTAGEVQQLFDRTLDYFARERDRRGFDPARGWMHSVAHAADVFKFLARNPHFAPANLSRLLAAIRGAFEAGDAVFVWGENDRMAWALHAAVRRPDADLAAFEAWTTSWTETHEQLWAGGPLVAPAGFARVENARQVLRSLVAILAMEQTPTAAGSQARSIAIAALARMR